MVSADIMESGSEKDRDERVTIDSHRKSSRVGSARAMVVELFRIRRFVEKVQAAIKATQLEAMKRYLSTMKLELLKAIQMKLMTMFCTIANRIGEELQHHTESCVFHNVVCFRKR
jgi:hypothetical protein